MFQVVLMEISCGTLLKILLKKISDLDLLLILLLHLRF